MSVVLVVAVVALVIVTGAVSALAAQVARSSAALDDEVEALAQLRAARELLAADLERTRRRFGRPTAVPPSDVWPSGPGR